MMLSWRRQWFQDAAEIRKRIHAAVSDADIFHQKAEGLIDMEEEVEERNAEPRDFTARGFRGVDVSALFCF